MNQETIDMAFQAIGWAYADCCADLDKGLDPRKTDMADVVERAKKDLELIETRSKE